MENNATYGTPLADFKACPGTKYLTYPDSWEFMKMITSKPTTLFPMLIIACIIFMVVFLMGMKLLRDGAKVRDDSIRSDLYLCVATPVVVSAMCLWCMFIPRANPGMYTISLAYLMFAMWRSLTILFRTFGDTERISEAMIRTNTKLPLYAVPLCCCPCLPELEPTTENINTLRWFVLQTPIVRMIAVVAISTIRVEINCDTTVTTRILSWVSLMSTLAAVYSCAILVKISNEHIDRYNVTSLFRCVNVAQALFSILRFLFDQLSINIDVFSTKILDKHILEARMQADFWFNAVMIISMVPISLVLCAKIRPKKSGIFHSERTHDSFGLPIRTSSNFRQSYSSIETATTNTHARII